MARSPLLRGALVVLALLAACDRTPAPGSQAGPGGDKSGAAPTGGAPGGGAPPALKAAVVKVESRRVPVQIEAVARTEGSREIEVRARVNGILEKRLYEEGSPVKAGETLFRIERAPFEIALSQARATLAQERARNEQARREAQRLEPLARERAISQREADDASSNLKASDASLLAAQARVSDAELNLSYTSVAAPIGGISGRALRSEGSLVAAGSDSGLLTTIVQADPIWVRFAVSESEFAKLRASGERRAKVVLLRPDGSESPQAGKLNFAASTVDPRLGTVQLRAEVRNPALEWLPGQFVRARVTIGERDALLVPQAAVLQGDQGRYVWVLGADGKAAIRPVDAGDWVGREWAIRSGLKPGDTVIVDNLIKLRPGAPVEPATPGAGPGVGPGAGPGVGAGAGPGAGAPGGANAQKTDAPADAKGGAPAAAPATGR